MILDLHRQFETGTGINRSGADTINILFEVKTRILASGLTVPNTVECPSESASSPLSGAVSVDARVAELVEWCSIQVGEAIVSRARLDSIARRHASLPRPGVRGSLP